MRRRDEEERGRVGDESGTYVRTYVTQRRARGTVGTNQSDTSGTVGTNWGGTSGIRTYVRSRRILHKPKRQRRHSRSRERARDFRQEVTRHSRHTRGADEWEEKVGRLWSKDDRDVDDVTGL